MPDIPKKMFPGQWRKSAKKPKLVVDTNLFVSGLLSSKGSSSKFVDALLSNQWDFFVSREIFKEYEYVIHEFIHISKSKREKLLGKIRQHANWIKPGEKISIIEKDPADNKFLECALAANADFLITGDRHLLELGKMRNVTILKLAQFKQIIG